MADRHTIENQLNQSVDTMVKSGSDYILKRVGPREQFEVDDADMSPAMNNQVEQGIFKIISTTTATPPVPAIMGVTADQKDALNGANSPDASNPFATKDDIDAQNEASEISYDNSASGLSATDVKAAIDELDTSVDANTAHATSDGTAHSHVALNDAHRAITSGNPHGVDATASYTVGTAGDWVAPAPTTIAAALDRIAAHVAAGGTGPIA